MDREALQALVKNRGVKLSYIAARLKLSRSALYRKLYGKTQWTVGEMNVLVEIFNMDDDQIKEIFFAKKVS